MPRIFLRLDDKFALGAGARSWILYRASHAYPPPRTAPLQARDWRPVAFVRSTKLDLLRYMRQKGCAPFIAAQVALDAMPPTFAAWKAAEQAPEAQ